MNAQAPRGIATRLVAGAKGPLATDERTLSRRLWRGGYHIAAQEAFDHRARCNQAARRGEYRPTMETP
jgi:hypothetical protein